MSLPAKIILLISLLLPGSVLAQSVSVTVDRTAMDINDVIRMQIAVEGAQGELALPQMPDFSIVSRSESTSISIINGAMSQQKGITLLLQPVKTGTLSIGEAKLIVNGKIAASSRPLTVKVTGGASPQRKKQPEPETEVEPLSEVKTGAKDGKNVPFFINAGIPERELFVGEGFLLGFDLYIRADVGVGSVNLVSQPKLEGFIVEGIPVNAGQKAFMKQADGAVYNVYPQFRAVITPAGAGDFTIDSLVLDLYSGDFFGNRRFRIASEPVVVKVSKLPEAGRPAGFQDGNIGKFAITSGLSKGVIKAGEKSVLTLEISGAGNFKNIAVTKIPQIKNLTLDLIPSSDMDDVRVDEAGISGKRYFQYLLTPSAPGEIEIPPFRFDYFNPISRKYETAESEPLTLKVLETGASVAASKEPAGGDELAAIVWDIGQGAEGGGSGIFKKYAHVFFVIPLTIILAAETIFRLKRRRESNYGRIKSDRAFRTAVRELRILKNEAKQDPKGIYEKIEGILNAYMSDGFSINIRGGGNIREELAGLGIDEAVADSLQMEIESFSFARFAPTRHHEGDIAGAFARVEKILRDLEKCREKAQKGKEGGAQSLPAILSVFAIISFPHFTISAAPGDGDDRRQGSIPEQSGINELFVDANRAYSNGDYETALKIYGKLSGDFRTETPALMFNTANVNFRTGRFGEAILLYKRVLKLSGDAGLSRAAKKNLDTVRETLSLLEEEKEGSVKYMATDYHDGTFLVFSVIPFDVSLFIALIAFTAFSLIFAVFRLRETPGGAIKSLAAALLVLSILCAVNLWGTAHVAANYRLGIVTEKDARVYDGKTLEAASIPAPEGLEVRILSEENGFYSIELTGGQNGYIPKGAVGVI